MGWLLKIVHTKDKKLLIFFNFIKIGLMMTHTNIHNGISIVFGIWRIEFQFNISFLSFKTKNVYKIKDMPYA